MVYDRPRDAAHAAKGRLLAEAEPHRDRQERGRATTRAHARIARADDEPGAAGAELERDSGTTAEPDLRLGARTDAGRVELHVVEAEASVQQDACGGVGWIQRVHDRGHAADDLRVASRADSLIVRRLRI